MAWIPRAAAAEAGATGNLGPFEGGVSRGVSANLCEALAAIIEASQAEVLDLGVSWSSNRHAPPGVPDRVIVSSDAVPVLRGAGRALRERQPDEDFELEGWVVGLSRDVAAEQGEVTIQAQVGGGWRRVRVELSGTAYKAAIEAHDAKRPVRCRGTLVKEGRGYVLKQARSFEVEPVEGGT